MQRQSNYNGFCQEAYQSARGDRQTDPATFKHAAKTDATEIPKRTSHTHALRACSWSGTAACPGSWHAGPGVGPADSIPSCPGIKRHAGLLRSGRLCAVMPLSARPTPASLTGRNQQVPAVPMGQLQPGDGLARRCSQLAVQADILSICFWAHSAASRAPEVHPPHSPLQQQDACHQCWLLGQRCCHTRCMSWVHLLRHGGSQVYPSSNPFQVPCVVVVTVHRREVPLQLYTLPAALLGFWTGGRTTAIWSSFTHL